MAPATPSVFSARLEAGVVAIAGVGLTRGVTGGVMDIHLPGAAGWYGNNIICHRDSEHSG